MDDGYGADVAKMRELAAKDEVIARTVDATRSGWEAEFDLPSDVFGDSAAAAELHAAHRAVFGSADFAVRDMASTLSEGGTELKLVAATYERLDADAARAYRDA